MDKLRLRALEESDCKTIHEAFLEQGWNKPLIQFHNYLEYQQAGIRDIIIAEFNNVIAGYLTIKWQSDYLPFRERGIPEIVDFNVFQKFQRLGIGTTLMDEAERRIRKVSVYAGIGFGVSKDYGKAQILYIKRGYIPDGNGLVKDSKSLQYGEQVQVDDDLVFCLTKEL